MRRVWLLDANLLIALTHAAHVHHADAHAWFDAVPRRRWATCALTQLAFIRLSCNPKISGGEVTPPQAMSALEQLAAHPQHEYWDDAPCPAKTATLRHPALVGHRQVTDAYLLAIAAGHSQCLATLDRGLVSFAASADLADAVELVGARGSVQEPRPRYRRKA
jgi:toxin-antitoxin system PIN domain toxin